MLFLIIVKKSKLINVILCLWKKTLTFQIVTIFIKSVYNKDKNNYCYDKYFYFQKKGSYDLPKNNDNKFLHKL